MKKTKISGVIMLCLCAMIWGTSFVAQSESVKYLKPLAFQAIRSFMAGTVLVPVALISCKIRKSSGIPAASKKRTLFVGLLCGTILCLASLLQQYGLANGTSGGKSGFITALYILIVPIIGVFLKKKIPFHIWFCIALGLLGLYFLCINGGFSVMPGDYITLGCAAAFAFHIVTVDILAHGLNGVVISCIQFFTAGIIATVLMFIFEVPTLSQIVKCLPQLLYVGIASGGAGYTLQILGQQRTEPILATLLMSFESVFAVLGTIVFSIIMGNPAYPTGREWLGCALMFIAIITAQLPLDKFIKNRRKSV